MSNWKSLMLMSESEMALFCLEVNKWDTFPSCGESRKLHFG